MAVLPVARDITIQVALMLLMDMFMADRRATGIPIPAEAVPTAVSVSAVTTMASTIIPISERAIILASATAAALVMAAALEAAVAQVVAALEVADKYALKGQKLYKQLKLEIK